MIEIGLWLKKDGNKTYLAGDIALHNDKFKKFDKVINIWGADHHGYVPRLKLATTFDWLSRSIRNIINANGTFN